MEKTALVGLHGDPNYQELYFCRLRRAGYVVTKVSTPEEMLDQARRTPYDRYLMDLNFGSPNSPSITPAQQVFEAIKHRVKENRAKFMGISGNEDTIKAAKQRGISAKPRLQGPSLKDFLN
jgi:hypothetical protein